MELPSDFGEVLGRLMNDPQIMEAVRGISQGQAQTERGRTPIAMRPDLPPLSDLPPRSDGERSGAENSDPRPGDGGDRAGKGSDKNRTALLNALSPYLSSDRRKKLDGIVRVIELIEFARTSHLLDDLDLSALLGMNPK